MLFSRKVRSRIDPKPLGFALACIVLAMPAFAADYGLPIGSPMPPFEAQDQNGNTRTLKDILGPNGAAIVFFRSADW